MITRFYADNYKCLINFEYKPKPFELIVGANGTGKTTVFEALSRVRDFIRGDMDAAEIFSDAASTRWTKTHKYSFEVEANLGKQHYIYHLELDGMEPVDVIRETLSMNGNIILDSEVKPRPPEYEMPSDEDGPIPLYREATISRQNGKKQTVPLSSPRQTALTATFQIHARTFRTLMSSTHFIRLSPDSMGDQVKRAERRPSTNLSNFAAYYFYLLQEKQGKVFDAVTALREVIPTFDQFVLRETSEDTRTMRVQLKSPPGTSNGRSRSESYSLNELSDGQRALVALYTLLYCTLEPNTTLVIDEPENYIALRELQPWLTLLQERLEEHGGQVILISHHPEFINPITDQGKCIRFYRPNNAHVRIADFNPDSELTPAEIVARGWEADE